MEIVGKFTELGPDLAKHVYLLFLFMAEMFIRMQMCI